MFDLNLARLSQLEYEERLREAELHRRVKAIQGEQPSLLDHWLLNLSEFLIDSGARLKQRVEMRPSLR